MSEPSRDAEIRCAIERAIDRVYRYGLDGPRPIEDIEILLGYGDELPDALIDALDHVSRGHAAAAIHLVRLLRVKEASAAIARLAFATAAPLEAKREALDVLDALGDEVEAEDRSRVGAIEAFVLAPARAGLEPLLEWDEEWRKPALEAWLTSADESSVHLVEAAMGRETSLDLHLVRWLSGIDSPEAVRVLQDRGLTSGSRDVVKTARRALHDLRSRGVSVPEDVSAESSARFSLAIEPDVVAEGTALMTAPDGAGARLIWMLLPSRSGGFRLLEVVLSDLVGVQRAEIMPVTRKQFRAHVDRMRQHPALLLGSETIPGVVAALRRAERRTETVGGQVPETYRKWREDSDSLFAANADSHEDTPTVYQRIDAESVRARPELLEDSAELLGEPAFASWGLGGEASREAAVRVREAETSSLAINDEQRAQQVERALASAAQDIGDDERQRFRRRLELTAGMLLQAGNLDAAERAVAAALGFTEVADLYSGHPFARALVQRGVLIAYQQIRERETKPDEGGRIIQP